MSKITLASWESRFWAWLIDVILVNVAIELFLDQLWIWNMEVVSLGTFGAHGVLMFLYWTVFEGYNGQSIGKMAMNLKVTDREGKKIDFLKAAVESIGKAFILPLDCLIGWLAMKGEKLRLFNKISGTIVVKTEQEELEGIKYEKD